VYRGGLKACNQPRTTATEATTRRQAASARAHRPCFILPNGAWEICTPRLVAASGRNTSQTPTSTPEYRVQTSTLRRRGSCPCSRRPCTTCHKPQASHSCVAVPSQTRQRLLIVDASKVSAMLDSGRCTLAAATQCRKPIQHCRRVDSWSKRTPASWVDRDAAYV
jgi:hypothetical protein